jgi:peroxisomal 2,4-dienoyl-CoA reductase
MGDKSEARDFGYADKVADIGHAAAFLFSPAAYWITGQVLVSHPFYYIVNDADYQAVDGGEHHMRTSSLPYPESVLDPQSIIEATKSKPKPKSKAKL